MRYYDIVIRKPGQASGQPFRRYTSHPAGAGGPPDPGALNVLLDLYIYTADAPTQQAIVQLWGIGHEDLNQSANFTGCLIEVDAGFQKGLPLNKPAQAGPILKGQITQAYGNWQGTDMTLDFVVVTAGSTAENPVNLSLNWLAGMSLTTALTATFTAAFPNVPQDIQISDKLVQAHDEYGIYDALTAFAPMLRDLTRPILGGNYDGVTVTMLPSGLMVRDSYKAAGPTATTTPSIVFAGVTYPIGSGGSITVPAAVFNNPAFGQGSGIAFSGASDNGNGTFTISGVQQSNQTTAPAAPAKPATAAPTVTQIAFEDLLGQPTWLDAYTITFACPMRADLVVGSVVKMPPGVIGGSAGAGSPGAATVGSNSKPSARDKTFFSGKFEIYQVHHMGNFRQPDGQSWITVYQGSPAGGG